MEKQKITAFVLMGVLIALRIYICFFSGLPNWHQDSPDYFKQADALLNGEFINYFPNGLPAIIALVKLIVPNHAETGMLIMNILLAAGTGWFVFQISKTVFNNPVTALIALALIAVFPTQINLTRWLTSEVAATFFLTGSFYFYFNRRFIAAGFFMAFATIVRTEFMFIAFLLIAYELIIQRKLYVKYIVALLIPILITGFYCKTKTGKFAIAGHSTVNILYSIHASGENIDWAIAERYPADFPASEAMKLYFNRMKEEPVPFFKDKWLNYWEMWGLPSDAKGTRGMPERLLIFMGNLLMLAGGIYTVIKLKRKREVILLTFPFIIITGMHIMMMALQRYIFPVEPFMLILTSYALTMAGYYLKVFKQNTNA
jgi:hypothetical protein